ncbi:hypothetical protein GCM10018781_59250 [Kitasatospora indigofera]|uniref:Uncharacterized protein n=1 Tax=Kitasatospora indigofera TaxID=67307 RepID=A0A919G9J6_9ACTN|nr:hypothetical protein GCM10018781_59250 [Kitasatospora indigofera]
MHMQLILTGAVVIRPAQRDRMTALGDNFRGVTGGFPDFGPGNPRLSGAVERSDPVIRWQVRNRATRPALRGREFARTGPGPAAGLTPGAGALTGGPARYPAR